nr:hypothetical protein [Tanacetum cinerariifolium]
MESQSETIQTVSTLKFPMLKIRDYDLWSMRMEKYLTHIDYTLLEVIMNRDAPAAITSVNGGAEAAVPPKTAIEKIAMRNELKAKSTMLLAIPDEQLLKFHGIKDAKTLWEAIKTRFRGNKESKKMQKTISKQQYENFVASRFEEKDANLKLPISLPPAWNTHTLIMQNKSNLDTLSMDDLYNNLKVYKAEIKGQSSLNSNSHNVAFVSSDNTSRTNEGVNTTHDVSVANNKDLEQIDNDDLEEMDLKWQKLLSLIRQRLNVTTAIGEVTLLESAGHQGVKELEMETIQEGLYQWRLLLMTCVNESEEDNNQANDRYKAGEGYHAVPLPYTRNFMPSRPDLSFVRLDDSVFKFAISETVTSLNETKTRSPKRGKIYGKGKIRTGKLDFEDVYFVKELKFNLFSVTQICDKKNSVLFTETRCLVLSPDFKLLDENQVLLKVPRQNDIQKKASDHEYILLPFMPSSTQSSDDKDAGDVPDKGDEGVSKRNVIDDQEKTDSSTQDVGTAEPRINTASTNINTGSLNSNIIGSNDPSMPSLEEIGIFDDVCDDREVARVLNELLESASSRFDFLSYLLKQSVAERVVSIKNPLIEMPDITFAVCACEWFQVTLKTSHLHAVKRIFRYLKGQPKLGLWYPRDSPFDLEAYSDSDYTGASLDRKSTTGEYVAAASCYGQVLWIQNQMLSYGFNLMNTKIYIDNESTSCIMKNPVFHSKTKHIEIRHHFIRDSYEKKLIQVIKIHTYHIVADLLTKAFDVS